MHLKISQRSSDEVLAFDDAALAVSAGITPGVCRESRRRLYRSGVLASVGVHRKRLRSQRALGCQTALTPTVLGCRIIGPNAPAHETYARSSVVLFE
jgi:hypothetical protein